MAIDHDAQTIVNWAGGVIAGLFGIITAAGGWMFTKYIAKIDSLSDIVGGLVPADEVVTKDQLAAIEVRVAELVSRKELITHLEQMREDRLRMHEENKDNLKDMYSLLERKEVAHDEFRDELRNSVHDLALKVGSAIAVQNDRDKAPGRKR